MRDVTRESRVRRRGVGFLGAVLGVLLLGAGFWPGQGRVGAAPPVGPAFAAVPASQGSLVLSRIDAMTKERLRHVWLAGRALGRRSGVLAKVGDSITASGSFLSDAGDGHAVLGHYRDLAPLIATYRATIVDRSGGTAHNSLNRHSLAAHAGWTAADLLGLQQGGSALSPTPLDREYAAINPAVAIIMVGSNDVDRMGLDFYSNNLAGIVESTLQAGIIPILTTIPDRLDTPQSAARTLPYNDAVRELATVEHIPLIDYWQALQDLPNKGLTTDLLHPSVYPAPVGSQGAVTFTPAALRYGWNLRNLLTLQMLAHVRALIFDDGPPDS